MAADKFGDREGLVVVQQDVKRNFSQLKQEIEALAAGLIELGLKPGERLGIWGPNTHEWYVSNFKFSTEAKIPFARYLTQFAAAKAGLILVNINPAYQPAELKYCLNKVEMALAGIKMRNIIFLDALASLDFTLVSESVSK